MKEKINKFMESTYGMFFTIITAVVLAYVLAFVAPGELRNNVQFLMKESTTNQSTSNMNLERIVSIQARVTENEKRVLELEKLQKDLATKQDLLILKQDLIRELKK